MDGGNDNAEARLRELEIKLTYLDDYVARQNETLVDLAREIDKLTRALRSLSEKMDTLDSATGENSPPADEKPPHW